MKLISGDKTYEIDELSLGEFRVLKQHFGVGRMDQIDPRDPDVLCGLLYLAARRADPSRDHAELLAEVESITDIDFKDGEGEDADPSQSSATSSESEASESADAPAAD